MGGVAGQCSIGLQSSMGALASEERVGDMPYRTLGRTGEKISVVCFPGLALIHYDQERCNRDMQKALDRGVNYFDVAPAYGNGEAETKMGIGIKELDRSRMFLANKTKMRDKEGARMELERSLKRLNTDHFDLYQLHYLHSVEEGQPAFEADGAMETILKAKDEGKIRHIGFSAHTTKSALAAMKQFKFDSVMFPINFTEYFTWEFGKEVIEEAEKQGIAVIGMKVLSYGLWPKDVERTRKWWYRTLEKPEDISMSLRFTLSQKGVVSAIPPSFLDLFDRTVDAAKTLKPSTEAEATQLKTLAKGCEPVFLRQQETAFIHRPNKEFGGCPYAVA